MTDPTYATSPTDLSSSNTSTGSDLSFLNTLAAFLQLVDAPDTKTGTLRASFRELKRGALREWPAFVEWAKQQTNNRLVWLVGELALDPNVLKTTKRRSLDLMGADSPVNQDLVALASTVQLTAKSLAREFQAPAKRRRELLGNLSLVGSNQPLFWSDPQGLWPVAKAVASVTNTEGDSVPQIARFATAGLPLAGEVQAREEILELARADRETAASVVRKKKLGLRALESCLRGIIEVADGNDPGDDIQREYRRQVISAMGKKPDIWHAIERARSPLFRRRAFSSPALTYWAEIAALTWVSTKKSVEALTELTGAQLGALFVGASDQGVPSLRIGILETISKRSPDNQSDVDWSVFQRYAKNDEVIGRWYDGTRSTAQVDDPLGYLRDVDVREQTRGFRLFVERSTEQELVAHDWTELGSKLAPSALVVGLTLLIGRYEQLATEREFAFYEGLAETTRKSAVLIERAVKDFQGVSRCSPEKLIKATPHATERLRKLADDLVEHAELARARLERNVAATEDDETEISDSQLSLLESLRKLDSQAIKSRKDARADRNRAAAAFRHAAVHAPMAIDKVIEQIPSLPAEAVGLLWDGAIQLGLGSVLATVEPISRLHSWGRRVWLDIMLHRGPALETAPALPDEVARTSREILLARVSELTQRLNDPDVTGFGRKTLESAAGIRLEIQAMINDLVRQLKGLGDSIKGAYELASTTGD